jgi:acyl-[acyl-carrier-protein] desaturase
VLEQDPHGGVISIGTLFRRVIAMPGRLMHDGRDADLFDHFSTVAQRIGVYTVNDYADIVRHLLRIWKVASLSLSGKAARAQDFLCSHADRIDAQVAKAADRLAAQPPTRFSWINDREV